MFPLKPKEQGQAMKIVILYQTIYIFHWWTNRIQQIFNLYIKMIVQFELANSIHKFKLFNKVILLAN